MTARVVVASILRRHCDLAAGAALVARVADGSYTRSDDWQRPGSGLDRGEYVDLEDEHEATGYRSARTGPTPTVGIRRLVDGRVAGIVHHVQAWLDEGDTLKPVVGLRPDEFHRDRVVTSHRMRRWHSPSTVFGRRPEGRPSSPCTAPKVRTSPRSSLFVRARAHRISDAIVAIGGSDSGTRPTGRGESELTPDLHIDLTGVAGAFHRLAPRIAHDAFQHHEQPLAGCPALAPLCQFPAACARRRRRAPAPALRGRTPPLDG